MPFADSAQWYQTPIQKGALPGGRDIRLDYHGGPNVGYHPGASQATFEVQPHFDRYGGLRRHRYWPPEPDAELVRAGIQPTSVKVGYQAPGYEAERYTGTNVPPWGQPVWFQRNRPGQRETVFGGMGDAGLGVMTAFLTVPVLAIASLVGIGLVWHFMFGD